MTSNETSTTSKIIRAALDEYFRYGLKSVSMDDVSKKLGISKKTLYLYVKNKEDLISKVISYKVRLEKQVLETVPNISKDAIHEMVLLSEHIIEHFSDIAPALLMDLQKYYPHLWETIVVFHNNDLKNRIESNILRGQQESFYRSNVDTDIIAKLYVSMCFTIDEDKLFPRRDYNRTHVIRELIMYHLQGILSNKGREAH